MKKHKGLKITAYIILGMTAIYLFLPYYLKTGLLHLTADIDDYKIFKNRIVLADTPQPWPLAKDYNSFDLKEKYLTSFEEMNTIAYLVVQNGKLLHEQYWDDYNQSSLSNSFSMAKSIIALLIGCALDEGKINSLDDPVGNYLKEFEKGENAKLTIRHLLTMSSGLDWDEAYASPFSKTTQAYYGKDLKALHLKLKVIEEPGKIFKYYSANTQILSFVLEAATGMKVSQYASEKLWKPLGAEHDALWSLDKDLGDEKAYCCFNSNAEDFARLGQLLLQDGVWNGQPLVSAEYIKEMTTPCHYLKTPNGNEVDFYGFQIWILDYKNMKIPYFRGILGQYIFVIPEKDAVIVRLGEKRSHEKIGFHPADAFTYIDAALEILN